MARVYVIQRVMGRDLNDARRFGELTELLPEGVALQSTGQIIRKLRDRLKDFQAEDYLLCMGDPVAIGLAAAVAADISGGRLGFLRWSRNENKYFPLAGDIHLRPRLVPGSAA